MIGQNGDLLPQYIRVRMNHNIITTVNLVQGDTAREFHFIFDDYIVPENSEIRIYVQKPSGLEFYGNCELKNNEIVVQPRLQMVAEKGKNLGQIQIINNGNVINTFIFYLAIEPNLIYSSSITSTNEFELVNDLIEVARENIPIIKKDLEDAKNILDNIVLKESDVNEIYDKANDAYNKANESNKLAENEITKLTESNNLVDKTLKKINDALENYETTTNPTIISITQPTSQNFGELWFVETVRE